MKKAKFSKGQEVILIHRELQSRKWEIVLRSVVEYSYSWNYGISFYKLRDEDKIFHASATFTEDVIFKTKKEAEDECMKRNIILELKK